MATRFASGRVGTLVLCGIGFFLWFTAPAKAQPQCVGDCDGSDQVLVNELVTCVNIALDVEALSVCQACSLNGTTVQITDLITAVNNALDGCPATPTATNTSPVTGSTPTATTASTSTATPISTSTRTPINTSTATPISTSTGTPISTATATSISTATGTPANSATSTPTLTPSPTPTNTAVTCPLSAGQYTQTTTGGALKVATFATFVFPAGGTTLQDVGPGDANCVHQTVVPFPGGLTVPVFCVPALGATTSVVQSGCGVGEIDSNGGSDFTVTENGDTSEKDVCNVPTANSECTGAGTPLACCTGAATGNCCPNAGPAVDSSGRLDVKVGNGTADTCSSGTANAIVSIPVNTLTWVAANSSCPDSDGMYNPGTDTQLAAFPQTLDLTTDTSVAQFTDLGTVAPDPDGCFKSGLGPKSYSGAGPNGANGFCLGAGKPSSCCTGANTGTCVGPTGTCIDIPGMTVTVAGTGTIFSSGGPTYDLLFDTIQNATIAQTGSFAGLTCGNPPLINFHGSATRCLVAP